MSRGIQYRQSGHRIMIQCPFHDDSTPSLSIHSSTGAFYCFGCHEAGPFFSLLAEYDGVPPSVAKLSWGSEDDGLQFSASYIEKELLHEDVEFKFLSWKSFHQRFPSFEKSTMAQDFLRQRRILPETAEKFDLRVGVEGRYNGRLIIPVTHRGKLATFLGRPLFSDMKPKYLFPRPALFTLFGLDNLLEKGLLKTSVLDKSDPSPEKVLYLVEGPFDAMYLQQFNVPAVAIMGTSNLSSGQLSLIVEHADQVRVLYDNDEAGKKAMFGFLKANGEKKLGAVDVLRQFTNVHPQSLPYGRKDPDQLTEKEISDEFYRY